MFISLLGCSKGIHEQNLINQQKSMLKYDKTSKKRQQYIRSKRVKQIKTKKQIIK